MNPPRIRRPIAKRAKDMLDEAYPLDRVADQRIDDLLDQLKGDQTRRASAKEARDAGRN